jgi:hypothetical protein
MPLLRNRHTRKRKRMSGGKNSIPTFHVVIISGGRTELKEMIDSLRNELKEGDALTIVFDGKNAKKKSEYLDEWTATMKCAIHIKEQIPGLKHWGHPTLNKTIPTLHPETTFIMYADDDDTYVKGSFDILRNKCTDPHILYLAKFKFSNSGMLIPGMGTKEIQRANIGKPNGIIPFKDAGKVQFGTGRESDFEYYRDLKSKVKSVVFLNDVNYIVNKYFVHVDGDK